MAFETLRNGSRGDKVKALQYILGVQADGIFGNKTETAVKTYQSKNKLTADGIAGKKTFQKIVDNAPTLKISSIGNYVYALECILSTMFANGIYSIDEEEHVKTFQASCNLVIDGIVGKNTWKALFGLTDVVENTDLNATAGKVAAVQPKDFKQYNSRWGSVTYTKNNTYNKNQTIRNSGCGVTAMADIVATWWDKTVTPVDMAKLSVSNGFRTENSGTAWDFFSFCAKKYKAKKFVQTSSFATMQNCLATGGYVVVSFRPSKWTKSGHFCVLWKDDGKTIYVNDPASASSARAKGTYSEVKNAAKQYFCFWK